ncbi:Mov34/MPN/PAD-1 family protein [Rhizobium redzepovicii]|uniref:Mov34/MPN/PAD-1 family protein n=1 Tax=Rhizobium redzepovicii TaxID=2867518 RepID=A0AAW8P5D0_9HYPH|nr:Mov34/MPN/PAD-1 family protein [Rhizobium redzepovicii]MDR9762230.1 Mov34/MPN/PAD-1 family protein [Rhizobium redzepovicii]
MAENVLVMFQSMNATVEVRLTDAALRLVEKEALASPGMETGGILIGRYEDDGNVAVITTATERPGDSKAGRAWFQRGIDGLKTKLRDRWKHGEHYLGEWHSHPGGAPDPSTNDIREMRSISINTSYRCRKPILVIAGTSGQHLRISVSVMENGGLIRLRPVSPKQEANPSVASEAKGKPSP